MPTTPLHRGKCTNTGGCQIAQERRLVAFSAGARCPECGDPLQKVTEDSQPRQMRIILVAASLAVIAGAVALGWMLSHPSAAPEPSQAAAPQLPSEKTNVTREERDEVLKRIDAVPNLSAAEKERLYAYVERSRRIESSMLVGFQPGRSRLTEEESAKVA